jgi:hypothetical protein
MKKEKPRVRARGGWGWGVRTGPTAHRPQALLSEAQREEPYDDVRARLAQLLV